jgi:Protein of unknown function (DUF2490)
MQLIRNFKSDLLARNISVCLKLIGFVLLCIIGSDAYAQPSSKAQEVWPSVDVYYRLNPKMRLYATAAGTKKDESSYSDAAFGVFFDYFGYAFSPVKRIVRSGHADSLPGQYLWLRGGYQYSATPPSSEDPFKENMLVTEANSRFYLPFTVLMTIKNRFDWRSKNGEFNGRYRPRLMLEKDLHTEYMFFTVSAFGEYFLNFGNPDVNRFRTQLGVEFRVTKRFNYEVYWNHQFANQPEVPEVDAFGMTIKAYLQYKKKKSKGGKSA